jgi:hypothetical protein
MSLKEFSRERGNQCEHPTMCPVKRFNGPETAVGRDSLGAQYLGTNCPAWLTRTIYFCLCGGKFKWVFADFSDSRRTVAAHLVIRQVFALRVHLSDPARFKGLSGAQ